MDISEIQPGAKLYTNTMYSRAVVVDRVDLETGTVWVRRVGFKDMPPEEMECDMLSRYSPPGAFIVSTHKEG